MKDPLLSNKIAGAVLAALILVLGLPQLTAAIFSDGHAGGHGDELQLAYCCVELETAAPSASAEPAPADLGTLLANASVSGGKRRAALCASCHTFEEGGANGAGPNLWNIVGRPVASAPGFNYTSALQEFGGAWTYQRLNEYLKNSQEYVPGTAMAQRFARDDQRADILAYLGSLSASPAPFPEPAAAETHAGAAEGDDEAANPLSDAADKTENIVNHTMEKIGESEEALPPSE